MATSLRRGRSRPSMSLSLATSSACRARLGSNSMRQPTRGCKQFRENITRGYVRVRSYDPTSFPGFAGRHEAGWRESAGSV
jgi:hypothetical protein